MGRPLKVGLDYFPIDLGMGEDESVAFVEAKFGVVAFGVLIKLLMKIYRQGYYMTWAERDQYLFLKHTPNIDITQLRDIVSAYINSGFFNENIAAQHQVLTSHGIQKRYVMACERRAFVSLCQPYACIVPSHEDFPTNNVRIIPVSVANNPVSGDMMSTETPLLSPKSTQSRVEKSRVEESKVYTVIFDLWNSQNIQKHRKLTSSHEVAIRRALKDHSESEILQSIENYGYILSKPEEFFFSYRWALDKFLRRGLGDFVNREIAENNFRKSRRDNGSRPASMPGNEPTGSMVRRGESVEAEKEERGTK